MSKEVEFKEEFRERFILIPVKVMVDPDNQIASIRNPSFVEVQQTWENVGECLKFKTFVEARDLLREMFLTWALGNQRR